MFKCTEKSKSQNITATLPRLDLAQTTSDYCHSLFAATHCWVGLPPRILGADLTQRGKSIHDRMFSFSFLFRAKLNGVYRNFT
jgi:hypothetical protein